jgi:hypothetical protein
MSRPWGPVGNSCRGRGEEPEMITRIIDAAHVPTAHAEMTRTNCSTRPTNTSFCRARGAASVSLPLLFHNSKFPSRTRRCFAWRDHRDRTGTLPTAHTDEPPLNSTARHRGYCSRNGTDRETQSHPVGLQVSKGSSRARGAVSMRATERADFIASLPRTRNCFGTVPDGAPPPHVPRVHAEMCRSEAEPIGSDARPLRTRRDRLAGSDS